MELKKFLANFENLFDETPLGSIHEDTIFRDIDEWSSLIALSVIAMVDEECNYRLTAKDFNESVSVKDLYNKIKSE